jgi:hypothetical protein
MNCINKCDSGLLHKTHKVTKNKYVFRCDCASGLKYKYPEWKRIDAAEYDSYEEIDVKKPEIKLEEW